MLWIEMINIVLKAHITFDTILIIKENQRNNCFIVKKKLGGFKLNNSQDNKSTRIELKFI